MRFFVPFLVLSTLFLVGDKSLNDGRATLALKHSAVQTRDWALGGAERMADTFTGFNR
jgi:hypothetical protein